MPSNIGLSIPLYYNLYTSPVVSPGSGQTAAHIANTLIYNQDFFYNTNIIYYGCSGVSYKGSSGLRSLLSYVVQSSNSIQNKFQTWDGSSLYEYSLGIMLYQPKQCGLNGVNNQCLIVCGDGIVDITEDCDDQNYNPFDGCSNCQYSCIINCQSCQRGICQLCNSGYQLDISNNCISICGDGIIQEPEQCDVLVQTFFSGCFNCQFQCTIECVLCEYGRCRQCLNGYRVNQALNTCEPICGDQIVIGDEECDDGNVFPLGTCLQCQLICPQNCTQCIKGVCQNCLVGWYLSPLNDCNPICGDSVVVGNEQCDDSFQTYKKCFNCQLLCDDHCKTCQFGICYQCNSYYTLNLSTNHCESICGNQIVQEFEQCDDGNQIAQDGCWNCQYDCPMHCQSCALGQCTQCNFGYYNHLNKCDNFCGDGIVVGNEHCDDGNNIFFDGCYICNWSCVNNCLNCWNGVCQQCEQGYHLFNQYCHSVCGDKIITVDEFCDDGNSYPFDNCHQCQRSCPQYCLNCSNGFCLSCLYGYYFKDDLCIPLCGDTIIAGSEQCDDGNLDIYDNCFNCNIGCPEATFLSNKRCINICGDGLIADNFEQCDDGNLQNKDGCSNCVVDHNYVCNNNLNGPSICYKCPLNCNNCQAGLCSSCINGYFLNSGLCIQCDLSCITCKDYPTNCIQSVFSNMTKCDIKYGLYPNYNSHQCYSVCGDSIKAQSEQCDDGNTLSGDGCNKLCQIENGWQCDKSNPSNCYNQFLPTLQITLQKQPNLLIQQLSVQLSFACSLYNNTNTDLGIMTSEQNLEITQSAQFSHFMEGLQAITYLVQLTPLQSIQSVVIYIFLPNNTFETNQSLILFNLSNKIVLFDLNYVSQSIKVQIAQISNWNSYFIYTIIAVSLLSLMIGSFEPILNMLDLMQYLSYLQYIDIPFPYILTTYFNIFSIVSMDLVMQTLGLTSINTYPFVKTNHKFAYYETNAYFLANFQSFLFALFQSYVIFTVLKILQRIIYNYHSQFQSYFQLKIELYLMRVANISNNFHFSGLVQLVLSSFYDLSFAILLFLQYQPIATYADYIYLLITLLLIGLFILIMNQALILSSNNQYDDKLRSLSQGVKVKSNHYIKGFTSYLLIKKGIFCLLIIFLQGYGQVQTVLVSMNSIVFICYFCYFRPLVNTLEHFKIVLTEITIGVGTLSFLIYAMVEDYLIIQTIEWINVFSFTFALFASLIIDIYQVGSKTYLGLIRYIKRFEHNGQNKTLFDRI